MAEVPAALLDGAVDVSAAQDGGIMKVIMKEGIVDEKPGMGDEVFVHYVGTLPDGIKFDSSRDRNEHFKFKLGLGSVIKGWDQGVATMQRGELCRLICKSEYAYGDSGSPPTIPPGATLIFEVELFDWKGEDLSPGKDGGIIKSVIQKGTGYSKPNEGAIVEVELEGYHEGSCFDQRTLKFSVGDGVEADLPLGVDIAIGKFLKGEESKIKLSPKYGFKTPPEKFSSLPANADLTYKMKLIDFEKVKEPFELEPDEKLVQSEMVKEKGASLIKAENYEGALKKYKRAIELLGDDSEDDWEEEQKPKRQNLLLACHLNSAHCQLKLEAWIEARGCCDSALTLDGKNVKGLYRRGKAFVGTKDWKDAVADFKAVIEIDPNNKAASKEIQKADYEMKKEAEKEKKMFAKMFGRSPTDKDSGDTAA